MAPSQPKLTLAEEFGGGRLLVSDIGAVFVLLNYLRRRVIRQVFGVSDEQANLLSWVILLMLITDAQGHVRRMMEGPPMPPAEDWLFGLGTLEEVVGSIVGPPAQGTPALSGLIALAVVAATVGPTIKRSLRGVRASSHRAATGFHHRYGYLVDPGHWRSRRAQRREALAGRTAVGRP
jgi:hypothetical protein